MPLSFTTSASSGRKLLVYFLLLIRSALPGDKFFSSTLNNQSSQVLVQLLLLGLATIFGFKNSLSNFFYCVVYSLFIRFANLY